MIPGKSGTRSRGMTLLELMIVAGIGAFLSVVLYRMLFFSTSSFSTGGRKLSNLQDASLLTLRLKNDIHTMVEDIDLSTPGNYKIKINRIDPLTGVLAVAEAVYSVVGSGSERVVKREIVENGVASDTHRYGRGNYESFLIEAIDINGVKGYKSTIVFQSEEGSGAIKFESAIFPRNIGKVLTGDNWEYF
jgi:prepilin-type N-terminal cleavage/methylation domain-containing protein